MRFHGAPSDDSDADSDDDSDDFDDEPLNVSYLSQPFNLAIMALDTWFRDLPHRTDLLVAGENTADTPLWGGLLPDS